MRTTKRTIIELDEKDDVEIRTPSGMLVSFDDRGLMVHCGPVSIHLQPYMESVTAPITGLVGEVTQGDCVYTTENHADDVYHRSGHWNFYVAEQQ